MSSQDTQLDAVEGQSIDWKKKYLKMRQKYKDMGVSSDEESSDDDNTQEYEHPAKKQCLSTSMDPLQNLLSDCFDLVLKWLPAKDVLNCMLVCKAWKDYIESNKTIMNRTMNKIVVKLTSSAVRDMSEGEFKEVLTGDERSYKHISTDFALVRRTYNFPFITHAPTIESLEINCVCSLLDCGPPPATDFPKLKNLIMECKDDICEHELIEQFISSCTFPEVKNVKLRNFVPVSLELLLHKFPNLKALMLTPPFGIVYTRNDLQPEIESLCLSSPLRHVLDGFKETLTELYLGYATAGWIQFICTNLKKLKVLGVEWLDGNRRLTPHETITTLKVASFSDRSIERKLMRAFPALETLVVRSSVLMSLVRFIATDKASLKRLICKSASALTTEFHAGLQQSTDEQYVNKNFELIFDPDLTDYEKEFYNSKFN